MVRKKLSIILKKKTIRDFATKTIRDLISILIKQARIPVRPLHHAIKQHEKHFESWKDVKRLRHRKTTSSCTKEEREEIC